MNSRTAKTSSHSGTAVQVGEEIQELSESLRAKLSEGPRFVHILAKSPIALQAFVEAERALSKGQLTNKQREQIALAVAEINDSDYCLCSHSTKARNCGLSEEDVQLARRAAAVDGKAEAMLRFVQLVTLQRADIRGVDLRAVLKAGWSEEEVVEMIANIALNAFTNYLNRVFGTEAVPVVGPNLASLVPAA